MLDYTEIKNLFETQLEPVKKEIGGLKTNQKVIINLLLSQDFGNLNFGTSLAVDQLQKRKEELSRR